MTIVLFSVPSDLFSSDERGAGVGNRHGTLSFGILLASRALIWVILVDLSIGMLMLR